MPDATAHAVAMRLHRAGAAAHDAHPGLPRRTARSVDGALIERAADERREALGLTSGASAITGTSDGRVAPQPRAASSITGACARTSCARLPGQQPEQRAHRRVTPSSARKLAASILGLRGRRAADGRRSVVGTPASRNSGSSNGNTTASRSTQRAHRARALGMPRPHLGRDVVEDRDARAA